MHIDSSALSPSKKREGSPSGPNSLVKRAKSEKEASQSAVETPMNVDDITPLKQEEDSKVKNCKTVSNQHVKRLPSADVPDLMSPQTNQNLPVQVMPNKNIRLKLK